MDIDDFLFDPDGELDVSITPQPLSDPVFTAIFENADVSGLAMYSLVNSTLEDSNDKPISEVLTVTPQRVHTSTGQRGYRMDVEAKSAEGEIVLLEVQLSPFASTIERNLLYAEQALASFAKRGETLKTVTAAMPRVIVVNVLEKALRKNGGFHQVVELLYREPPYERATDKLEIHNLELEKFRESGQADAGKPLHCWLAAICRAQDSKKPEVVRMDPQLEAFYEQNPGFAQFVDRHGVIAAAPEVRKAFRRWEYEQILEQLEEERRAEKIAADIAAHEAKGRAEGRAKGREEGQAEGQTAVALNLLKMNLPIEHVITATGLTREEVERLSKAE